MYLEDI